MKTFQIWCLFLLMSVMSIYGTTNVGGRDQDENIEQAALFIISQIQSKTPLTKEQQQFMKQTLVTYIEAREVVFAEAEFNSTGLNFSALEELYADYKHTEESILTENQLFKIYKETEKTISDHAVLEVEPGISPMISGSYNYDRINYKEISGPQTITLGFYETYASPTAYYIDFGDNSCITVEWEVDFMYGESYVEIYTVESKTLWYDCIQRITGVSSGSLNTTYCNGKLLVYIPEGQVMDGGNVSHAPLKFTFKKGQQFDGDLHVGGEANIKNLTVSGTSVFNGNVGIGVNNPSESLVVNGTVKAKGLDLRYKEYEGDEEMLPFLSIPASANNMVSFITERDYFHFDKPIRVFNGQIGSYGANNLQFQTNGTTHMTVLNSNGNVGIGTSTPGTKLEVNGTIKSSEMDTEQIYATHVSLKSRISDQGYYTRFYNNDDDYAVYETTFKYHYFNKPIIIDQGRIESKQDLDLAIDGGSMMKIKINGNVGINIYDPKAKLHVGGDILLDQKLGVFGKKDFYLQTDGITRMTVLNSNGNIGIGINNPEHKLDVAGTIRADEVMITTTNGADFVFEEDYRLLSLREVKQHILEKKHLPDIPSAAEMKENGVGMADLQIKLLQKVEELTLYIIQQQELIEEMRKELNKQNRKYDKR